MKHRGYESTCKKCKKSLNFYEDSLALYECFHCRKYNYAIPSKSDLFPYSIKNLIKFCKEPFETRIRYGFTFDLYRVETVGKVFFFGVQRNNYERITWMSLDEAGNFTCHRIIDDLIKEGK